jgi:hypothetical protein
MKTAEQIKKRLLDLYGSGEQEEAQPIISELLQDFSDAKAEGRLNGLDKAAKLAYWYGDKKMGDAILSAIEDKSVNPARKGRAF